MAGYIPTSPIGIVGRLAQAKPLDNGTSFRKSILLRIDVENMHKEHAELCTQCTISTKQGNRGSPGRPRI